MPNKIRFQPEGYHTVNPYLAVKGASKLLEFLQNAFGAQIVVEPFRAPDGTIMHSAVRIGDSMIGLADAPAEPSRATLSMYVEDTDAAYERAIAAGAISLREPMDTLYGERSAGVQDPCGNQWWLARRTENLSREEILARAKSSNG
jgi:PhnB protein